ncbi:MAG TPA: glycosyltransferase, partial [Acidiferrobacteraceae bacterium]|nr:glycosyltransferase [Acidiferrobacteraceae bacterium]
MAALFIISAVFVAYTYLGYPLLMAWRARARAPAALVGGIYPPVAVLIPAFNEAGTIGAKLRNVLSSEYPGPLKVLVVSDGSTDDTVAR